jgi:hypothetical protein
LANRIQWDKWDRIFKLQQAVLKIPLQDMKKIGPGNVIEKGFL